MISIYTSAYNLTNNLYNWRESLDLFSRFANEVIVSTTINKEKDSYNLLVDFTKKYNNIVIVATNFSFGEPDFDGKLKNAALQVCTKPYCMLLDLDEKPLLSQKQLWEQCCNLLGSELYKNIDGFLIASINLYKDIEHYKDIGYKFYLHKNFRGLKRGVVNFAKNEDGSIDISKSDTTEVIKENGDLGSFVALPNDLKSLQCGSIPYILHFWGVDLEKRIERNKFWFPVWENRAQKQVKDIPLSIDELKNIEYYKHGLKYE